MTTSDWVTMNTFHKGRRFVFDDYPFQKAIVDDLHPNMDVIKPSQVGMTEVQIRKIIALLMRNRGTKAIYTMPNLQMQRRISQTRVAPIINETPLLNNEANADAIRSVGIMQLDSSYLYITASNEGDATSIDADFLFNDEIDITDPKMLALFGSRLQNSNFKIQQRFSTPTFPGKGIDAGFKNSDQHEYMLKCHGCNHWQIPTFSRLFCDIPGLPDHIEHLTDLEQDDVNKMDIMAAQVVCERCRIPLDLKNAENRQWVAEYPERKHARGYRIRPFSTDRIPIHYILERMMTAKRLNNMRSFYNTVLGEAHAASNNRISEEAINRCFEGTSPMVPDTGRQIWVGVDMGLICHFVILTGATPDTATVVEFGTCAPEELKQRIVDKYGSLIRGGIVDRLPYTPTAKQLQRDSNGKIVPIQYGGQIAVSWKKDENYAVGNRTLALDEVMRQVNRGMKFYGYGHMRGTITTHLMDMVRDDTVLEEGWAKWEKITGDDHFFHALGYALLSFKLAEVIQDAQGPLPGIMFDHALQDMDKVYNIRNTLGLARPGKAKHSLTFR